MDSGLLTGFAPGRRVAGYLMLLQGAAKRRRSNAWPVAHLTAWVCRLTGWDKMIEHATQLANRFTAVGARTALGGLRWLVSSSQQIRTPRWW
jgi:hypothetical protein